MAHEVNFILVVRENVSHLKVVAAYSFISNHRMFVIYILMFTLIVLNQVLRLNTY
jgi:hypothetical protein